MKRRKWKERNWCGLIFQVELKRDENQRKPNKVKCELALGVRSEVLHIDQYKLLADDEELELRELQAGSNPLTCSAHFNRSGLHGCSLCKGWFDCLPCIGGEASWFPIQ